MLFSLFQKLLLFLLLGSFVFTIFSEFDKLIAFPDSRIVLRKSNSVTISPKNPLRQEFVATRDNLQSLQFLTRSSGIREDENVHVVLYEENCATPLREGDLMSAPLDSGNLAVFHFPKIADSQGKKYCVALSYQREIDGRDNLRFFTMVGNNESSPALIRGGEERTGEVLALRPVYRNATLQEDLVELNREVSQYKPAFLKHHWLFAIASLSLFFPFLFFLFLLSGLPREENAISSLSSSTEDTGRLPS